MKRNMAEVPDRRALRRMAGESSFERGKDYYARGQVRALVEHEGTFTARVRGTREYRVKLSIEDERVAHSCTCPVGAGGAFCKHCVAAGLAWLAQKSGDEASRKSKKPSVTMADVRAYLAGKDKNALVDMLMDQAMDDDRLRERLLMQAAKKGPKGLDLATFREAIDNAVEAGGFVEYAAAHAYARRIEIEDARGQNCPMARVAGEGAHLHSRGDR